MHYHVPHGVPYSAHYDYLCPRASAIPTNVSERTAAQMPIGIRGSYIPGRHPPRPHTCPAGFAFRTCSHTAVHKSATCCSMAGYSPCARAMCAAKQRCSAAASTTAAPCPSSRQSVVGVPGTSADVSCSLSASEVSGPKSGMGGGTTWERARRRRAYAEGGLGVAERGAWVW